MLLRFDRDVPWCVVAQVLQRLADPDLKLYRCFVSVRDESTAALGAIGLFMPKDMGLGCADGLAGGEAYAAYVGPNVASGWPVDPHDRGALIDAMRRMQSTPDTPIQVVLTAAPSASWSSVVRVIDAGLRARVWSLVFEGLGPEDQATIAERMAASRAAGPFGVVIRPAPRVDQAAGAMANGGRVPGLVGFSGDQSRFYFEKEIEEDTPPEPSDGRKAAEDR